MVVTSLNIVNEKETIELTVVVDEARGWQVTRHV